MRYRTALIQLPRSRHPRRRMRMIWRSLRCGKLSYNLVCGIKFNRCCLSLDIVPQVFQCRLSLDIDPQVFQRLSLFLPIAAIAATRANRQNGAIFHTFMVHEVKHKPDDERDTYNADTYDCAR